MEKLKAEFQATLDPIKLESASTAEDQACAQAEVANGPLLAALVATLFAIFTLLVTHHFSRLTPELEQFIFQFGAWIPWTQGQGPDGNIGSYGGKETLALGVWAASWLFLHFAWRQVDFDLYRGLKLFLISLGVLVLGFFHPLADPVVLTFAKWLGILA